MCSVGPCALDYSRTKSHDQFWTDPPADELVQRHRISSGYHTSPPCRTPINVHMLYLSYFIHKQLTVKYLKLLR